LQGRKVAPSLVLSIIVALAIPNAAGAAKFTYGVTAGEITSRSARIWGHATNKGRVKAEVARDKRFRKLEDKARVKAKKSRDFTVQKTMKGLKPGEKHFYRFCKRKKCSEKGTFETAPKLKSSKTIRFAYSGDTDANPTAGETEPFWGHMLAFKSMLEEKNDFNIHMGDTMYSDSEVPEPGPVALTRAQKWAKYKLNLGEPNLTNLRRSAGFYSHWDDHEFINDFSIPEDGQQLYDDGVRAFRDYTPVTYSERNGLYRRFRWGKNAELFFLDQLSFRSGKASAGGTCDNPETGEPDLAPTAPQSTRNTFSLLIPSLDQPVSQQCKNAINDPNRTMLGNRQFNRFVTAVEESNARWKIVVNEKPIQQIYGLPYDRWEGYAFERIRLLQELEQRGVGNLLFLTTDTHAAFQNVVRQRTLANDVAPSNAPAGPTDTAYQDFIIGPVATNPFWPEIDDVTGGSGNGRLLSQLFFKPDPPNGLGMACSQGNVFSYAQVVVSRDSVRIEYKDETGQTVEDVNGEPCGPYTVAPFAP
jgi:alkaline phosphatase D